MVFLPDLNAAGVVGPPGEETDDGMAAIKVLRYEIRASFTTTDERSDLRGPS